MEDIEDMYERVGKTDGYENFPASVVLTTFFMVYGGYTATSAIFWLTAGRLYGFLSAIFSVYVDYYAMSWGCVQCYYYGKWCARAGRGKVAALLFNKFDTGLVEGERCRINAWGARKISLPVIILFNGPSMLAMLFGMYHVIFVGFSFTVLGLILFLVVTVILQGSYIEKLACKNCKNRDICPGLKMMKGEKKD